jgi:hypothetical protein
VTPWPGSCMFVPYWIISCFISPYLSRTLSELVKRQVR